MEYRRIEERKNGAVSKRWKDRGTKTGIAGEDRRIGNDLLELAGGDRQTAERTTNCNSHGLLSQQCQTQRGSLSGGSMITGAAILGNQHSLNY